MPGDSPRENEPPTPAEDTKAFRFACAATGLRGRIVTVYRVSVTDMEDILSSPIRVALFIAAIAAAVWIATIVGRWNARRKLEHWAKQEGLRLVEFRGVPFWRSPRGWTRNENQEDYEVVVIDRQGQRREGMVFFSGPWHGFGPQEVDVRWDET